MSLSFVATICHWFIIVQFNKKYKFMYLLSKRLAENVREIL